MKSCTSINFNSHSNAKFITEQGADVFKCVSKVGSRYAAVVPQLQNNTLHLISMLDQTNVHYQQSAHIKAD